ncbi:glycoside hydrolase family 38 N-terminal domain-containing protein, partial [Mycoplasma marinum]
MKVGYLPDSFGHNPQTPQILRQVGLDNFTFYRGLDPKKVKNKLYFDYVAPSGDKVLGIWQTHYFTSSKWKTYEGFMKTGYKDNGTTGEVTVESYDKRTLGGPIFIPMGGDMRNFEPKINDYIWKLNEDERFHFKISSYEDAVADIQKFIKDKKIKLTKYKGELRDSLTGRAHRSIISARMDLKQRIYDLESSLIEVIEPLSVVASKNGINVPWKMIERSWKDLFKTSAHDSYGGCVEDLVNRKMMQRLEDALLITRGVETMLMKIMSFTYMDEKEKNQVFIMNLTPYKYTGPYKIQMSYEPEDEGEKFSEYQFLDSSKVVAHLLDKRTKNSNNNRILDDVTLYVEDIKPFSIKSFNIKYLSNNDQIINKKDFAVVESKIWKIKVENNMISLLNKKNDKTITDFIS